MTLLSLFSHLKGGKENYPTYKAMWVLNEIIPEKGSSRASGHVRLRICLSLFCCCHAVSNNQKPGLCNHVYIQLFTNGLVLQLCLTLQPHGLWPARLLCPWDSPGKNAGVNCHALLQGSSQPRHRTQVSHNAGRFFTV